MIRIFWAIGNSGNGNGKRKQSKLDANEF